MRLIPLLLLVALPVLAQTLPISPCTGNPGTSLYTDFTVAPFNGCAFEQLGTGTPLETARTFDANGTLLGWTAWWHCSQPNGGWSTTQFVASAAVFTQSYYIALLNDIGVGAAIASTPADTLKSLSNAIASRVALPLSDPLLAAIWCPHIRETHVLPPLFPAIDGTLVPPWPFLIDASGVAWTILPTGFVARNGVATNGHAVQIELRGGVIYVQSPTGGFWWQWLGSNQWLRLTTAKP